MRKRDLLLASLEKWSLPIGAILTAFGVLIGFSLPIIACRWSGPAELDQEHSTQIRAIMGTALVLLGAALQIYGSWPAKGSAK
jgi:hypothetical protein